MVVSVMFVLAGIAFAQGAHSYTPIGDALKTDTETAIVTTKSLVPAPTISTPNFSIGILAATGPDLINATAGYKIEEFGNYRLFLDILYGFETESYGAGLSLRAETTGIQIIDTIKNIFQIDGVGGGVVVKKHEDPLWLLYGVYEF